MRKAYILGALVVAIAVVAGLFLFFGKRPVQAPTSVGGEVSTTIADDSALKLVPQDVQLKDGKAFSLNVAQGFRITPAFEGLKRVRFMAKSPDGRLFLTDMYDLSDNTKGKVYILDDFDDVSGRFGKITTYLEGLRNPNSVAFYLDPAGKEWLYVALTDKLLRYPYKAGDDAPSGAAETIATFPDYGLSYKYGGWHLTRTVAFHGNKLYVSVGSSCNACEERLDEPSRASIMEMDPDGSNARVYASGLRNAVGIRWIGDEFFATAMSVDHLGNDAPQDTFQVIRSGANYGWPYCYEQDGAVHADDSQAWKRKNVNCEDVPLSFAPLGAHSAPLGFDYFAGSSDPALKGHFLVALHGSGNPAIGRGYSIARVRKGAQPEDFINGFLQKRVRYGRPADVLWNGGNSFFFTDDLGGVVYYVSGPTPR